MRSGISLVVLALAAGFASCSEPELQRAVRDSESPCVGSCLGQRPGGCILDKATCMDICGERSSSVHIVAHVPTVAPTEAPLEPSTAVVLGSTIGIETLGGVATPLIPRCSLLPAHVVEGFATAEDDQSQVEMHLISGEAARASEVMSLGRFHIRDIPPAPRGEATIDVTMMVGRDGVLRVTAQDRATRAPRTVTIVTSPSPR